MGSSSWISAHIHYRDDLDRLIVGAVYPLLCALRASDVVDRHFFVRHWQGGPHLRLRLLPRQGADSKVVKDALERYVQGFLDSHPSRTRIQHEDYLQIAEPLSRFEPAQGTIEALAPDDSVQYCAYEPEYDRYGGTPEAMQLVERHFTDSSAIVSEVIASGKGRNHRTGQALSMLFIAAAVCEGGSAKVGAFWGGPPAPWGRRVPFGDPARHEAEWERRYLRQRARLHDVVRQIAALAASDGRGSSSLLIRWRDVMHCLKEGLVALHGAGRLRLFEGSSQGEPHVIATLRSIVMLCGHMHCNRLGISLPEEAYLRYLLARLATEEADHEQLARG